MKHKKIGYGLRRPLAGAGMFAGVYNFRIGATDAEIAARNARNMCGPRGTPLNPSRKLAPLAGVNVDANAFNDRLPFDNRFVTNDPDKSHQHRPELSQR